MENAGFETWESSSLACLRHEATEAEHSVAFFVPPALSVRTAAFGARSYPGGLRSNPE